MADSKTTQLAQLAATPAVGDQMMIVDVSDTTMAASGTNKRLAASYLARSDAGAKLITGNGLELTVPQTDTAAVLGLAQSFSALQTFLAGLATGSVTATGVSMVNANIQAMSNFTTITNGILLVMDTSGTQYALFALKGGANGTQEIIDPNNTFSAIADTANSINIYYSSGYKVQNNRAYTTILRIIGFGT